MPEKVCVVAPGPSCKTYAPRIPKDRYIIAVSKAVLIPDLETDLWMMNHSEQDWFELANNGYKGPRVFGSSVVRSHPHLANDRDIYTFKQREKFLGNPVVEPVKGRIRFGATVSGCAPTRLQVPTYKLEHA